MLGMKDNNPLLFGDKSLKMELIICREQEPISHLLKIMTFWKHSSITNIIKIDWFKYTWFFNW